MIKYREHGERALVLNSYAEHGELAILLRNPDDPLLPLKIARLELRTAIESWRPPFAAHIASSRDVGNYVEKRKWGGDPDDVALVLCLNAKNKPNLVAELREIAPDEESFRNIAAMALLTGSYAVILVLRADSMDDALSYVPLQRMLDHLGLALLDINVRTGGGPDAETISLLDRGVM